MKTSRLFCRLGVLVLAAVSSVTSLLAFEGKVDIKTTEGEGPKAKELSTMSYRMKGEKMRMDFGNPDSGSKKKKKRSEGTGAMIFDFKKKEMVVMMDEEKMYMVRTLPEDLAENAKKKKDDAEFKATGRKEKIAGVEAEEYSGKSGGYFMEVWVTKEMGRFMSQQGAEGKGAGLDAFMQKESFFPLRTIMRKKADGPEELRTEVIAIDRSKQDDALFTPPGDYKKFEMPAMPGMGDVLKGMIPGR